MIPTNNKNLKILLNKKVLFISGIVLFFIILFTFFIGGSKAVDSSMPTYTAQRGNLIIDVLEAGDVQASESQEVRSEVEGKTTILSIVPEGTIVTEEDVKNKKVLVELDASELRNNAIEDEIDVQNELANLTEAQGQYDIQKNQNDSTLKQGELNVKFAKMDIDKYLGEKLADLYIKGKINLADILNSKDLAGETFQKKRLLENAIVLAKGEYDRGKAKYEWTKKLETKGYVTHEDLVSDEMEQKKQAADLEQAEMALTIFRQCEFPKGAETLLTTYQEAEKELERIIVKNRSELTKAEVKLKSCQATYQQESDKLDKLKKQIENCKLTAKKPGLVIYAQPRRQNIENQIKEGTEISERQIIITIPNPASMIVKTKIHESAITKVRIGQQAIITLDAMPDKTIQGTVKSVSALPDSQDRWTNPDVKLYPTDVKIVENSPNLKSGMSAQVRIIVNELKDVLMIPIQAVGSQGEQRICYVLNSSIPKARKIETGEYNDSFIEVKKGLEPGEKVMLYVQSSNISAEKSDKKDQGKGEKKDSSKRKNND